MLLSQLLQASIQAVYFVCIARALGVDEYGRFIAVASLAATLAPFAMAGMSTLVLRNVARVPSSLLASWGNALVVIPGFGLVLTLLVLVFGGHILPARSTLQLVACIAVADMVFANVHQVTADMYLAVGNARRSAQLPVTLSVCRMIAAAALFLGAFSSTAASWAWMYLASTLLATGFGYVQARRSFGAPGHDLPRLRRELGTGLQYAVGFSSMTIYNDIDKTLVARLRDTATAGSYAAGYRVVGVAMTPIFSLLRASFAQFFRHGEQGVIATAAYSRKLLPTALALGVVSGITLYFAAPLAPIIFGAGFEDSSDVMRLLAVLPVIKAAQNLLADALTGADRQRARTIIQLVVAGLNIGLNIWLIPLWSYRGAIVASIVSDGLLLVLVGITLYVAVRRAHADAAAALAEPHGH
jgi:O-antigen/teichoic acid export membrane protein